MDVITFLSQMTDILEFIKVVIELYLLLNKKNTRK